MQRALEQPRKRTKYLSNQFLIFPPGRLFRTAIKVIKPWVPWVFILSDCILIHHLVLLVLRVFALYEGSRKICNLMIAEFGFATFIIIITRIQEPQDWKATLNDGILSHSFSYTTTSSPHLCHSKGHVLLLASMDWFRECLVCSINGPTWHPLCFEW